MAAIIPVARTPLRRTVAALESSACLGCQWRSFSASYRHAAVPEKELSKPQPAPSPLEDVPRAYGKAVESFTPKPLSRPIGLPTPPRSGENRGIDNRSWKQRRDDMVDYDKHLVRRKELTQKMSTPYYREWSNMRFHKGKSFIAPTRLFKADKSLYFPNMYGQTLVKGEEGDTTPVLQERVSIISVFSSAWAEGQTSSFVAENENPELHQIVNGSRGLAQMVQINIEENRLKAMIVKLFIPNLRRLRAKKDWGKYFIVRKGLTDEIREAIGLMNSQVGYTYLLDGKCRIRWAGSGNCEGDEKEGLIRGTRRLLEEATTQRFAPQSRKVEETRQAPLQSEAPTTV